MELYDAYNTGGIQKPIGTRHVRQTIEGHKQMIIQLDSDSGVPVYRQISEQISLQITNGVLPPGTELPSTRDLAKMLGVNPMTVSKSYVRLEKEQFVERRPGLTLIVSERSPSTVERGAIQRLKAALEPAATLAVQLGIPRKKARGVFRKLLKKTARDSDRNTGE